MHLGSTVTVGALFALFALFGLFASAKSTEPQMQVVGLVIFVCAVLADFFLLKKWFDRAGSGD